MLEVWCWLKCWEDLGASVWKGKSRCLGGLAEGFIFPSHSARAGTGSGYLPRSDAGSSLGRGAHSCHSHRSGEGLHHWLTVCWPHRGQSHINSRSWDMPTSCVPGGWCPRQAAPVPTAALPSCPQGGVPSVVFPWAPGGLRGETRGPLSHQTCRVASRRGR